MNRTYKSPPSKGFYVYEWDTDCDEPIVCHLEYTKACRGGFQDSLQTEPDDPEQIGLCAAYLLDVDIFGLLSQDQIDLIEEKALEQRAEEAREHQL